MGQVHELASKLAAHLADGVKRTDAGIERCVEQLLTLRRSDASGMLGDLPKKPPASASRAASPPSRPEMSQPRSMARNLAGFRASAKKTSEITTSTTPAPAVFAKEAAEALEFETG